MLRDGWQIALDQVIESLLEAGNAHQQAAERLEADPGLARTFGDLAVQRRRAAIELGEHARRLGGLPAEPDADLEAAKDVLARVQLALADDVRDEALAHARQAEEHLAETVGAALEEDLPADVRAALQDVLTAPGLGEVPGS